MIVGRTRYKNLSHLLLSKTRWPVSNYLLYLIWRPELVIFTNPRTIFEVPPGLPIPALVDICANNPRRWILETAGHKGVNVSLRKTSRQRARVIVIVCSSSPLQLQFHIFVCCISDLHRSPKAEVLSSELLPFSSFPARYVKCSWWRNSRDHTDFHVATVSFFSFLVA